MIQDATPLLSCAFIRLVGLRQTRCRLEAPSCWDAECSNWVPFAVATKTLPHSCLFSFECVSLSPCPPLALCFLRLFLGEKGVDQLPQSRCAQRLSRCSPKGTRATLPAPGAGSASLPAAACARKRPWSSRVEWSAVRTGGARTGLVIAVTHETVQSRRDNMFCDIMVSKLLLPRVSCIQVSHMLVFKDGHESARTLWRESPSTPVGICRGHRGAMRHVQWRSQSGLGRRGRYR